MIPAPAPATTATGETEYTQSRKAADAENGTLSCSRVEIEPTANGGFSVRKFFKTTPSKGDSPSSYRDPDTYAFSTFDELSAFLQEAFGAERDPASSVSTDTADDGSAP